MNRTANREGQADLAFWVYHGTENHIRADMPLWLYRTIQFLTPASLLFVGEYPSQETGIRVIAVSMFGDPERVRRSSLKSIMRRVIDFNRRVGGAEVVLGGVLPNRFGALNLVPMEPISLENDAGPVYGITEAIEHEFTERNLVRGQDSVGILGVGRIGGRTMRRLRQLGHRVVAVEKAQSSTFERGLLLYTNNSEYLLDRNARVLVVITRGGDDIREDIDRIPEGCTVFDETFPPMSLELVHMLEEKQCIVSRIFLRGVRASRAFGGYTQDEVPACLVQPMVRVAAEKFAEARALPDETPQDWVDRVAREVLQFMPNIASRQTP